MTVAPDTPRLTFTDLADAVDALRERGLRLTTPRRLVLEALFSADGPVSAEYIASSLNLELTSVYRNLEALEQHGLARHVHLGHGPGLYALVGRGEREFLSCERCGAVRTLTADQLDPVRDQIKELFGYEARFTHFAIVGICPACAREPGETAPQPTGANGDTTHDAKHARELPHGHEHSHGDHVHSHPHSHKQGRSEQHEHEHNAAPPRGASLPQARVD
jgi:Fur family ferric uptake transcriptional regulator